ncbi:MAG: arsenate reductase (thioredoxin), partial [Gammaproteobacteria bacterium]|nr:arsenate reductase (thioredoxin) [Gammaproteobacteria bacterium]
SDQESTLLEQEMLNRADLIITLCDHAKQYCPAIPKGVRHVHWNLEDPAQVKGTEQEIVTAFKKTRDIIRELTGNIPGYLEDSH